MPVPGGARPGPALPPAPAVCSRRQNQERLDGSVLGLVFADTRRAQAVGRVHPAQHQQVLGPRARGVSPDPRRSSEAHARPAASGPLRRAVDRAALLHLRQPRAPALDHVRRRLGEECSVGEPRLGARRSRLLELLQLPPGRSALLAGIACSPPRSRCRTPADESRRAPPLGRRRLRDRSTPGQDSRAAPAHRERTSLAASASRRQSRPWPWARWRGISVRRARTRVDDLDRARPSASASRRPTPPAAG